MSSAQTLLRRHPIAAATATLAITLYLYRSAKSCFHPLRNAPRTPQPLIRIIDMIFPPKEDPFEKLVEYAQNPEYQPLVVVWGTIEGPILYINDADLIKEVLVNGQANYNGANRMQRSEFSMQIVELILGGRGILGHAGEEWKWRRHLMVPLFQSRRLVPALFPFAVQRVDKLTNDLAAFAQSGKSVDMDAWMVDLTFDIICKYLFGLAGEEELDFTDVGGKGNIKNEFDTMLGGVYVLWTRLPIIGNTKWATRSFRPARERIESFLRSAIDRSLARPDLYLDPSGTLRPVVHELVRNPAYVAPRQGEHSQALVTELMGLIFAGHDTTSHTAAFAFGEIAKNPEIQSRLFEEVRTVLGEPMRMAESCTMDKLASLKYLTAVVKETQRIYPVSNFSSAETTVDQTLAGQFIPAGQHLLLNFRGAHMDPRHFPSPFTFDPTRWLASSTEVFEELDSTSASTTKSLPELAFSVGTHACLGRNLAMLELRTLLAFVVNRYELALQGDTELRTVVKLTMLPKDGVWVTLKERE